MRIPSNLFFIIVCVALSANCGGRAASGSSENNANAVAANGNANLKTANPNANAEKTNKPFEVPIYDNAEAALADGKKFFDEDEDEAAIKALEQAVKLDPNLAEAYLELGVIYEIREKKDTAPEPTPPKGKKNAEPPDKPSAKMFKEAIKLYEKAVKKNPKDAAAYFNLGRAYDKIFEVEDAEAALAEAVDLQPDDAAYRYEHAAVLMKLAKYEDAVKELKKTLEIDPDNARAAELLEKADFAADRVNKSKSISGKQREKQVSNAKQPPRGKPKTENANTAAPPTVAPTKAPNANKPQ
jgi:tetratricopeptide (TPR) repeat protein